MRDSGGQGRADALVEETAPVMSTHGKHAACDCRSYFEHQSRLTPSLWPKPWKPCAGPLATIHVERHLSTLLAASQLADHFPWIDASQFYGNGYS